METKESFFNFRAYKDSNNNNVRFEIRSKVNEYQAIRDVIDYLGYNKLDGDYELTCRGNTTYVSRQSKVMEVLNTCITANDSLCK